MLECTQRRTYKSVLGFFFGFLLFQGVFASPLIVEASAQDTVNGTFNPTSASVTTTTNGTPSTTTGGESDFFNSVTKCFANIPTCFLVPVFDAVANIMGRFAGAAAGLFIWVVDPANISGPNGILNKGAVYDLWRFIRDFFNLFFILILLLSAFATVFQLESFSIRKIFLNILLAALIINFSFPITRFLIDFTNVPMYYFLNSILPGMEGGKAFVDSLLANSGIGGIATQPASADVFQAFSGAVFMFLFAISLLVLGVMMLVRIVALTLLLVFSPFGFAASLLPGMQDLGRKWWAKFWNYAFFGPAAALVLLVAIRFQNEIGKDGTFGSIVGVATNTSPDAASASLMARVVFYAIPIILIWTAIGMANSFSIAGASKVVGMGEGAARRVGGWAKRGTLGTVKFVGKTVAPTTAAKGLGTGLKEGWKGGKLFGAPVMPKSWSAKARKGKAEEREAYFKGFGAGGSKGANAEAQKLQSKRQYEAADEMKKNNVSNSELEQTLRKGNIDPNTGKFAPADKVKAAAAAMVLTDRKAIQSTEDFTKALAALGDNTKEIGELIEKVGDGAIGSMDEATYKSLRQNTIASTDVGIQKQLDDRIVKAGNAKILVDHKLGGAAASANAQQIEAAVNDVMKEMKSAKDVAKQESLFNHPDYSFWALQEIQRQVANNSDRKQAIKKASSEEGTSVGPMI